MGEPNEPVSTGKKTESAAGEVLRHYSDRKTKTEEKGNRCTAKQLTNEEKLTRALEKVIGVSLDRQLQGHTKDNKSADVASSTRHESGVSDITVSAGKKHTSGNSTARKKRRRNCP